MEGWGSLWVIPPLHTVNKVESVANLLNESLVLVARGILQLKLTPTIRTFCNSIKLLCVVPWMLALRRFNSTYILLSYRGLGKVVESFVNWFFIFTQTHPPFSQLSFLGFVKNPQHFAMSVGRSVGRSVSRTVCPPPQLPKYLIFRHHFLYWVRGQ